MKYLNSMCDVDTSKDKDVIRPQLIEKISKDKKSNVKIYRQYENWNTSI